MASDVSEWVHLLLQLMYGFRVPFSMNSFECSRDAISLALALASEPKCLVYAMEILIET